MATTLFPNTDISLGGFSTGGALSIDYLQRHPREQNSVKNLLLFDPAVALPQKEETVLNNVLIKKSYDAYEKMSQPNLLTDSDNAKNPSRVPARSVPSAVPLWEVMSDIRKIDRAKISTPTINFFSNGFGETGSRTIDAEKSQEILYGNKNGTAGVLSGLDKSVTKFPELRHNQIPVKKPRPLCSVETRPD